MFLKLGISDADKYTELVAVALWDVHLDLYLGMHTHDFVDWHLLQTVLGVYSI